MLLETFKTLVTRFKKHETSNKNKSRPVPPAPPSTDEPGQVSTVLPAPTLFALGTQYAVATPPVYPVAASSQPLASHASGFRAQMHTHQVPDQPAGFFTNSHHNVINNSTMISVSSPFESGGGAIMQLLEDKTIQGAEHDSSARYPPPKCHPETRRSLREEISDWVSDPKRSWRMFYILGTAGVGKSAVAQSVADEVDCLGASCFISRPNHRNDPDGVIPTLAYQLAVKHHGYKQIISQKLGHDRSILRKSRRVQFKELLIDPFHTIMTQDLSAIRNPLLIIIDGLDECEDHAAQCEFIELIGDHVRVFLEFPLLWLICSRPESHLKYALSQADFQVTCRREEMSVNDDESRQDVLVYLRSEFRKIRSQHPDALDYNWPPEGHLRRIAAAASGLFAFASTVIRFISDADAGDPSSQLQVCINALRGFHTPLGQNPYHALDILYQHILTSIPSTIRPTTMRILGMSIFYPSSYPWMDPSRSVREQANFLRIRKAVFYHALKQLHSILRIPSSSDAFEKPIEFYHASFGDFLKDPRRSGEFYLDEAAIHYGVALTALSWHTDLAYDIRRGDMWVSPMEDIEACLQSVKNRSLSVFFKACSRVGGKNALDLHQQLQKLDFNVLGSRIPSYWNFRMFLYWLDLLERNSLTNKLLNVKSIDGVCHETDVTDVIFPKIADDEIVLPWENPKGPLEKTAHLTLGNGDKRRHLHYQRIPFLADLRDL